VHPSVRLGSELGLVTATEQIVWSFP